MGAVLETPGQIAALLADTRSIAVLGMKPDSQPWQPGFFVPRYLADAGFEVIPIPVYYPELATMLDRRVYRSLALHLDDLLAARPRAVWLQSGIRHDTFAARLVRAGIDVVQDRCLMIELQERGR